MSTVSSDDFSAYDLSEFTEEDLQRADAHVERIFKGGPQIIIQVEVSPHAEGSLSSTMMSQAPHASESPSKGANMDALSPIERHRKNGVLSVTDLASLAWCEVQFDYGLRQRRHMPVASRPKSFISAQGKEISVAKEVAMKNDVRLKQGVALHKKLEREVKPEELRVEISSKEEQWALRLVNMLASLRGIRLEGYTREFPAFGILHDQAVVGTIDEVTMLTDTPTTPQKRPSSPARSKSKKSRRSLSPSQHLVTEYFPNTIFANPPTPVDLDAPSAMTKTDIERPSTPEPSLALTSLPRRFFHLSDTKTRKTRSLPTERDTLPSRIQLMLYYRLLKDLTSLSPPFDFAAMWRRVGVDPVKTLSTKFLVQTGLFQENDVRNTCLNDLANTYLEMVKKLDITGMDMKLDIVYRFLDEKSRGARKKRNASPIFSQEERDLSKAIEASLVDARASIEPSVQGNSTEVAVQPNSVPSADTLSDAGTPTLCLRNSSQNLADTSDRVDETSANTPRHVSLPSSSKHDRRIIGIKSFEYDEQMLDSHIIHALSWWRGDREPEGVSLEDSGRCRSCEYANNCEWRELKALEVQVCRQ